MAQRRKRNKKWISWIIILVLLISAGVVCYFVWDSYFKDKSKDELKPIEQSQVEKKESNNKTEEKKTEEKTEEPQREKEKDSTAQYEGNNPNTASGITGAITYAGVSGDNLMIRVNIDQYLNGGKCTLALRQGGGNVYSMEASVVDSASTSTCEGFNVPVGGLPNGTINIIIYINSGDKTGEIAGEVSL